MPHLVLSAIDPQSRWLDYAAVYSFFTLMFSFLAILVLVQLLPQHKNRALLCLLPASLYFTFNRYDILPSLVCLISLWLLARQRWASAALALAVGVLTKWYLILLLPIYLVYYYALTKRIAWSILFAFGLTGLAILLPTLILGGVQAVLMPYQWHLTTEMNTESLAYLLDLLVHRLFGASLANPQAFAVLFALQFATIPLYLSSTVDSFGKVVEWSALSILCLCCSPNSTRHSGFYGSARCGLRVPERRLTCSGWPPLIWRHCSTFQSHMMSLALIRWHSC